jgi:DNA-binding response OmpR family regulator
MPAKKPTILVAESQPQLLRLMILNLQLEGYGVLSASNGQQTIEQIEQKSPDLVLLGVMMLHVSGFSLFRRIRALSQVPIIIVVARGQSQDKVRCLDLGADDCLTRPFGTDELLARVSAVLRLSQYSDAENVQALQAATSTGDLTIDYARHLVMKAGKEVALTPTEYRLLAYLARHVGQIVTQDALLEHVWEPAYVGESDLLQANIVRLRRKIEDDPAHPHSILTKAGIGYELASQASAGELSFWSPWYSRA